MAVDYRELQEYLAAHSDGIVEAYCEALRREGNPLASLSAAESRAAVVPILAAASGRSLDCDEASQAVGQARAGQVLSPVDSLRAASTLYHVCADVIGRAVEELDATRDAQVRLVGDVHDAIMHRVTAAALPYANVILRQIHSAQKEERKRIARDLHDRAGYAIAIALQQIELEQIAIERGEDPAPYSEALGHALREAAAMVQEIAVELGQAALAGGLSEALEDFIVVNGEDRVSLQISGEENLDGPEWIMEQVYLAIREGVRNALRHSQAPDIRLSITAEPSVLHAEIVDEGLGFHPEEQGSVSSGKGLVSMYERVQLLSGHFIVDSAPGRGTTLRFTIPLAPA